MIKGCKSLYLVNSLIFNVLCIGTWCNGNTTVFGAVVPGSNPGAPTIFKWGHHIVAIMPALQAGHLVSTTSGSTLKEVAPQRNVFRP